MCEYLQKSIIRRKDILLSVSRPLLIWTEVVGGKKLLTALKAFKDIWKTHNSHSTKTDKKLTINNSKTNLRRPKVKVFQGPFIFNNWVFVFLDLFAFVESSSKVFVLIKSFLVGWSKFFYLYICVFVYLWICVFVYFCICGWSKCLY